MKLFSHSLFLIFCLSFGNTMAQQNTVLKPLISEKFTELFLREDFDSSNTNWTTLSNSENLFLVQDGEYILNRKATSAPYAVIGNFENNLSAFRIVTSIKLERAVSEDAGFGVIFMAQTGGQGGFIFEINKNQQYRLRQIVTNSYKYLTGNQKEGGWVKSSFVKNLNIANLLDIRALDKNYDIYINNNLLLSFNEISYKTGELGFIIGPSCKGKVDFLYLFTNEKGHESSTGTKTVQDSNSSENDVMSLAESIITLRTEINKYKEENDDLKQIISSMKSSENENDAKKIQYEKTLKSFELQLKKSQVSYDSLIKINNDLLRYKEIVVGNDGGDIVISLSRNLKAEKLKNEALQKTIQQYKDSLNSQQSETKQNKNKPIIQKEKTPIDTVIPDPKKEFSLPN